MWRLYPARITTRSIYLLILIFHKLWSNFPDFFLVVLVVKLSIFYYNDRGVHSNRILEILKARTKSAYEGPITLTH